MKRKANGKETAKFESFHCEWEVVSWAYIIVIILPKLNNESLTLCLLFPTIDDYSNNFNPDQRCLTTR